MLLFVGPHDHIWIQVIKSTTGLNIQISVGRGIDMSGLFILHCSDESSMLESLITFAMDLTALSSQH